MRGTFTSRLGLLVALALSALAVAGCTGTIEAVSYTDSEVFSDNETDAGTSDTFTAPGQVGDPCSQGSCEVELACVAGICRRLCASTGCNEAVDICADDEACIGSDTIPEVCLPAKASEGDECGGDELCVPGTTCVEIDGQTPRCVRLCSQGCELGETCEETLGDCKVCSP